MGVVGGGDAVEQIARLTQMATAHTIDGRTFLADGNGAFVEAIPERRAEVMIVRSLTGFVGFVEKNLDDLTLDELLVHVESPTRVQLVSPLSEHERRRNVYLAALYQSPLTGRNLDFGWGRWLDLETFNIALQALFVGPARIDVTTHDSVGREYVDGDGEGNDRARVLALVGNVKDGRVNTTSDDGVTQTVEAKVGIAKVENAKVPNPVTLIPYRTFGEIEQPSSPFVLRLRSGAAAEKVTAALFEADGGAWEAVAIQRIVAWLKNELPKDLEVIG